MSDRTDAEREAERLERERRRAQREGGQPPAQPRPQPPPMPEPSMTDPPRPEPPMTEPPMTEPVMPAPAPAPAPEPTFHEAVDTMPDLEPPTASHDHEHDAPSGTRRISALERMGERPRHRVRRGPHVKLPHGSGRRSVRKRVGAGIALVLAAAAIWFLIELFQPFIGSPHGKIVVRIPHGSTAGSIGDLLERDGVISSSFFFNLRASLDGDRGKLYAGTYTLQLGMSYSKVLDVLTTRPKAAPTSELTLTPGKSRLQVQTLLSSQGITGSYVAATRRSPLLDPHAYGAPRSTPDLEGFLFPDTYQLRSPIKVGDLVADQLKEFKQQVAAVNFSYARHKGLTPYDVLIIASMVESETPLPHDRPLVAAVIYNRLRLGMTLGIDATVQYATGNYTKPLTQSQLNSASPYNTRVHAGLPPTPIDSPSLASIKAAAQPAASDALYFVAVPCGHGRSVFTNSNATFLHDSALYQQSIAPGAHCK